MIKTILHLFKIHREVIFRNPSVVVQDMLGKTPKSFNAVDVILASVGKGFAVVQAMVLAPTLQGVVTPKGVGVIDRAFSGMLSDMSHQFIGGHTFHNLGIHPSIALQKAKYNAFAGSASSASAFASAAEIGLINLDFALELACLKLGHMIDRFAQTLVDACNHLIIKTKIACNAIGRLLLVESGNDTNLSAQTFERFLFSARRTPAFHIAAPCFANLKRTTKNALPTPQKVGRTVENVVFACNHKDILHPRGYETH